MSYFYEIRNSDNAVVKRDGGFANQDAAKEAARADPRKHCTTALLHFRKQTFLESQNWPLAASLNQHFTATQSGRFFESLRAAA